MGELIGYKVPAVAEDADEPSVDEIKQLIEDTKPFLALLYGVAIDPLGDQGRWAEADIAIAMNEQDQVVGYKVVRVSVDDNLTTLIEGVDQEHTFFEFAQAVAVWAHSVEGMHRWTWYHIHPEGMGQPSDADNHKVAAINIADLLTVGHVGGPRTFNAFIVTQRAGQIVCQTDAINGVGPVEDALSSRVYANSYIRTFGWSDPLAIAMDDLATAFEEFAASPNHDSPLAMMMFGMAKLIPLQQALEQAKNNLTRSDEEMRDLLQADYEANGSAVAEGKALPPRIGFAPPQLQSGQSVAPADVPDLLPGILSDLASFDFDSLDA